MNNKLDKIIKTLLLGTNKEIQRIPLEYDMTLEELKKLYDFFQIKDSDALSVAQVKDEENFYPNSNISTIIFNNALIEIQNDINEVLGI